MRASEARCCERAKLAALRMRECTMTAKDLARITKCSPHGEREERLSPRGAWVGRESIDKQSQHKTCSALSAHVWYVEL